MVGEAKRLGEGSRVGEREAQPVAPPRAGLTHQVAAGDSEHAVVERYAYHTGALEPEARERVDSAYRLWNEDKGVVALGQPFAALAGESVARPSQAEFEAFFRHADKLGRLPDARAGEKSSEHAARVKQVIDEGARPAVWLSPQGSEAVSLRRGRERARLAKDGEPALTKIPTGRAPDPAAPQGIVDHELVRLCEEAGVPAADRQQLAAFCARYGVRTDLLRNIITIGHYRGAELTQALKATAIVVHTGQQSLVDAEQRLLFKRWVFDYALRAGKLRFEVSEQPGSHAGYDYKQNKLLLPKGGIDLGQVRQRAYVVHELQHVVQDALKATGDSYQFEGAGHRTFAEYMLRAHGVLREQADGTLDINLDRALALWTEIEVAQDPAFDPPDKFLMKTRIVDALVAAQRNEPGYHVSEGTLTLDEALKSFDRPEGSFASVYGRVASLDPKNRIDSTLKRLRTDLEVEAKLRTLVTKDGLEAPAKAHRREKK